MRRGIIKASRIITLAVAIALLLVSLSSQAGDENAKQTQQSGQDEAKHSGPECIVVDRFFADEVWAKVGERTCLKCHSADGDAADSEFVLQDTTRNRKSLSKNQAAFQRMASKQDDGKSLLLLKVSGKLDHGGGEVLKSESTAYRIFSIMFMGRGIKGNRVIGATDEKQFLIPINPKSLSTDKEKGIRVRTEHIHVALRKFAGIDVHVFSKQFPLDVPDEESLQQFLNKV